MAENELQKIMEPVQKPAADMKLLYTPGEPLHVIAFSVEGNAVLNTPILPAELAQEAGLGQEGEELDTRYLVKNGKIFIRLERIKK